MFFFNPFVIKKSICSCKGIREMDRKTLKQLQQECSSATPNVKKLIQLKNQLVMHLQTYQKQQQQDKINVVHQNLLYVLTVLTKYDMENGIEYMEQALKHCPPSADVYNNLGYLYSHKKNMYELAIQYYQKCLHLNPKYVLAIRGLSFILHNLHLFEQEVHMLEQSLKLLPDEGALHSALGLAKIHYLMNIYNSSKFDLDEILTLLKTGNEKNNKDLPAVADNYLNMAFVYNMKGQVDLGIEHLLKSIETVRQGNILPYQNILLNIHYFANMEDDPIIKRVMTFFNLKKEDGIVELRKQMVKHMFAHMTPMPPIDANDRTIELYDDYESSHRKYRIGFVTGDWNTHAVGRVSHGWLSNTIMETYAYSDVYYNPAIVRNEIPCDHYRYTKTMNTATLAKTILDDNLDFLVDMSGFTANNRCDVFWYLQNQKKPMRFTAYGYPNHTYIPNVRRITDVDTDCQFVFSNQNEYLFVDSNYFFLTYTPPRSALSIEPKKHSPRPDNEIVFGCFARLSKINDYTISLWSRLLGEVPNSKLVVKSRIFCDKTEQQKFKEKFAPHQKKIICLKHTNSSEDHLKLFRMIDIHLDTYPYSGTMITFESLYMNIPVVAMYDPSKPHVANVSAMILKHCDLPYCTTEEDYISEAKTLIDKRLYLNVREKFLKSKLCDYKGYATMLDSKLIDLYRDNMSFEFI